MENPLVWRPMSEAKKDPTVAIIGANNWEYVFEMSWWHRTDHWVTSDGVVVHPIAWLPMPAKPEVTP
jgi:hypothetical protein